MPHEIFSKNEDFLILCHEGVTYAGVELLQEAIERYLKGYLVSKGWSLERTHDLRKLIEEASRNNPDFKQFTDFADSLTEQFWAQHYPGEDLEDVGGDYDELRERADKLVSLIMATVPKTSDL